MARSRFWNRRAQEDKAITNMSQSESASNLGGFRKRLEERIRSSGREPKCHPADLAADMQRFQDRSAQFDKIAPQLLAELILPRLSHLVSMFPNASLNDRQSNERASCWLGYCERFPASAKIEIVVSHDAPVENAIVRFEANIFPSYQLFEPHDKLLVPLAAPDEAQIVQWIEERLLEFLEAYLRIDRGVEEFEDEVVTDPVCGMRLARGKAVATADLRGHQYFFCAAECQQQFLRDPAKFIVFRGQ
jgi:YHS domain-containing protein